MTKARNCRGIDPDGVAETEAYHFMNCPGCGERAANRLYASFKVAGGKVPDQYMRFI
jgi:hypothetical protein